MREVKYYSPVKRALVFAPEKTEHGVFRFLRKAFPYLLLIALGIPASLFAWQLIPWILQDHHEFPVDPARLAFYTFLAGILFTTVVFLIASCCTYSLERLRKQTRRDFMGQ